MRLTTRHYLLTALLVASFAIASGAPAPAQASIGSKAISDCVTHLRLTRTYTIPELQNALQTLPADVKQYSNCQDVIQRALLTAEGKLHGTGPIPAASTSGGSALPTALIVVLVLLALGAVTLAAVAIRRRRK